MVSSNWDRAVSGRLDRTYESLHDVEVVSVFMFYDITEYNDKRDERRRKNQPDFFTVSVFAVLILSSIGDFDSPVDVR